MRITFSGLPVQILLGYIPDSSDVGVLGAMWIAQSVVIGVMWLGTVAQGFDSQCGRLTIIYVCFCAFAFNITSIINGWIRLILLRQLVFVCNRAFISQHYCFYRALTKLNAKVRMKP